MDLYTRQREFIAWLQERVDLREDGLAEKSRDIGFTWMVGGYAWHQWRFNSGFKTTFGSRKEALVDRRGDPDSIFGKIRLLQSQLPRWMWPVGFDDRAHDNHMRLVNPANDNVISGEAGDNIGRGGRSTLLIIDEGAHLQHAEMVDAASSATADVRIWGSSVNGMGNLFARKRFSGGLEERQIFRFHWKDDPRKTPEWERKKRNELEEHVWAAEYDIDYAASIEGICIPAKWVQSAIALGKLLEGKIQPFVRGIAGLDVGAGKAKSVYIDRFGPVVHQIVSWGDPDTTNTANKATSIASETVLFQKDRTECRVRVLNYDSIGIGAGVQSALKHHQKPRLITYPINVGTAPSNMRWPDGGTSAEKFHNLKAEIWFLMRARFQASHNLYLHMTGGGGFDVPLHDVIVLPPLRGNRDAMTLVAQLSLPRWGKSTTGKVIIESKESLTKRGIASPDHAEALSLTFAEPAGMSYISDETLAWAAAGARL